MSDMQPEVTNTQSSAILNQLSNMQASLAVNTSETVNIKNNIIEIKNTIKEIQNDSVSRREHNESMLVLRRDFNLGDSNIRNEFSEALDPIKKILYGLIGTILLSVLGAILKLTILK